MGTHRAYLGEHLRVVGLAAIAQYMRVRVGGDREFPLPDESADLGPGAPLAVQQADPPVPQIVRREDWDSGRFAGATDRGAQPIRRAVREWGGLEVAILPWRKARLKRIGKHVRQVDPQSAPGLGCRGPEPQPPFPLVVVADRCQVDGRNPGTGPVEPEQRQTVGGGEEAANRFNMSGLSRLDLFPFLVRKTDTAIPEGVRLDAGVIEDGSGVLDRLPDRLSLASLAGEGRDKPGDVFKVELVDAAAAKNVDCATQSDAVKDTCAFAHVDPRGTPLIARLRERRHRGRGRVERGKVWPATCG